MIFRENLALEIKTSKNIKKDKWNFQNMGNAEVTSFMQHALHFSKKKNKNRCVTAILHIFHPSHFQVMSKVNI